MVAEFPPMGWNSWDCYGAAVNEEQVRQNADYMAEKLLKYGWEYVVVDIEWYQPTAGSHEYEPFSELTMDEYGRLIPAANRFPSAADGAGFKPLADYIHDKGLKFGIHIMRGMPRMAAHTNKPILNSKYTAKQVANPNSICAWNPDMYGLKCESNEEGALDYYRSIFELYASWGVDFVKLDDIAREYPHCKREIELISKACKECGRDIVLSLSPGPAPLDRAEHLKTYSNMWRITDDFWDRWDLLLAMFERAEKWCVHAGKGHWPDADMLPVGALRQCYDENNWTEFTEDEQITMMSLWCMMKAPLMVGTELTKNDDFTYKLLTNEKVLDIDQNSFGGHQLYRTDDEIAWIAYGKECTCVNVALFNISEEDKNITLNPDIYDITDYSIVEELWSGKKIEKADEYNINVKAHGSAILRFSK